MFKLCVSKMEVFTGWRHSTNLFYTNINSFKTATQSYNYF